jgi:hypothetical protein
MRCHAADKHAPVHRVYTHVRGGVGGGLVDGLAGRRASGQRGALCSPWHRAAWHWHRGCAAAVQQGTGGSSVERPLGGTRWDAMAQGGRRTGGQC